MIEEILKEILVPEDKFIFGTADLRGLLNGNYKSYSYGLSIGRKLDDSIVDGILEGPTLEYYDHYKQVNLELAVIARKIQEALLKKSIHSAIIEPTVQTDTKEFWEYLETLTVDVSHKMVATRAGIGWIGKTDLFISPRFGPRLRLVSLLIDKKPERIGTPIEASRCGKCNICVDCCPAQAANGLLWNTQIHRDLFFDAHKCRDKCGELAKKLLKVDKRICGLCVSVCPVGRR